MQIDLAQLANTLAKEQEEGEEAKRRREHNIENETEKWERWRKKNYVRNTLSWLKKGKYTRTAGAKNTKTIRKRKRKKDIQRENMKTLARKSEHIQLAPILTSGAPQRSVHQAGRDGPSDNLEERACMFFETVDGADKQRKNKQGAKETTENNNKQNNKRSKKEKSKIANKARLTRTKVIWLNKEGKAVRSTHKELDLKARTRPRAIDRKSENARRNSNAKNSWKMKITRALTKTARKALKRLQNTSLQTPTPARPPQDSPEPGSEGFTTGPLKRTKTRQDRERPNMKVTEKWDRIREMRHNGILQRIRRSKLWIEAKEREKEGKKRHAEKEKKKKWGKKKFIKSIISMIRAMIFNVEGINCPHKRQEIEEYAYEKGVSLGLFSETQHAHSSMEEGGERTNPEGETIRGRFKWYFSSGIKPEDVEISEKNEERRKEENTRNI